MIKTPLSTAIGGAFWTPNCTILGGQQSFSQLIKKLFSNGEQGFFYDPNDLSTMYQDAAGTVPVTAAGQLVGLMLDKSKGLRLGAELNPNQNFDNLTGWTTGSATTAVIENSEAKVTFGGSLGATTQNWFGLNLAYVAGKVYTVSFDATYISGGNLEAGFGYKAGILVSSNANGGIKTRYTFTAGGSFNAILLLAFAASTAGSVWKIDNVSIKEVSGNHAYQTTSSMRPILRQNAVTGAYYLAFDGTDDFLVTNSIDFTATDKVTAITAINTLGSTGCVLETGTNLVNTDGTFGLFRGGKLQFGARGTVYQLINMDDVALPEVLVAKADIENAKLSVYKNRQPLSTMDQSLGLGNFGNYPLYIGRRAGTSLAFRGHIYSLISVGRLTTDAETKALEKLIAKNTEVTLSV